MSGWRLPEVLLCNVIPGVPPEILALMRFAYARGPEMLADLNPARFGLLAIHPRSPVCPDWIKKNEQAVLMVVPRAELERYATAGKLRTRPRPGQFLCLLYGKKHCAPMIMDLVAA